ncbi:MAG: carboxypeptidase-like regulatory domain-containing protein, partial [Alistipes sp.]|nr:carboxypeptidase-like regulatory domain-containing protein [Alistipes sp.]
MKQLYKLLTLAIVLCSVVTASAQQSVTVKGVVTDASDATPLIGVSIITGPGTGVTTGVDGAYSLTVAAGTNLVFQYLGYKTTEWIVPQGQKELRHDVALELDVDELEEVVVVAYGTRKKGTIAGSVSTVKSEKLESVPAAGFDQALQGQSAGLMVLSNSGEPSKAASFQIRGTNSINSGTAPLFILDGVPISSSDFNA